MTKATPARSSAPAPYYLRLELQDKPGALAKIAHVLGEAGISIDRMRQYGHDTPIAPVLIVTHKITRDALEQAVSGLGKTGVLENDPVAIRIENV